MIFWVSKRIYQHPCESLVSKNKFSFDHLIWLYQNELLEVLKLVNFLFLVPPCLTWLDYFVHPHVKSYRSRACCKWEKCLRGEMLNCLRLTALVSFSRQLYITRGLLKKPSTAELARSYCSHAFLLWSNSYSSSLALSYDESKQASTYSQGDAHIFSLLWCEEDW